MATDRFDGEDSERGGTPAVLAIGGSDSSGGSGIQADLKTLAVFGCHGYSAVTAVTAQGSGGVQHVHPMPPEAVRAQIDAALRESPRCVIKTGMLANAAIVREVVRAIRDYKPQFVIVDPVLRAKGGAELLDAEGRDAMVKELFPLVTLITPNTEEAGELLGRPVLSGREAEQAATELRRLGPGAVLVKGGHLPGNMVTDYLCNRKKVERLAHPRVEGEPVRGTGCRLASCIAAQIGAGVELHRAIRSAQAFLEGAIRFSYLAGAGMRIPLDGWVFAQLAEGLVEE